MKNTRPVYCRPQAFQQFCVGLEDLETVEGLFRAVFAIALHERPEADLAASETVVENLVSTVQRRVRSRSVPALLAHLHDVLFEVFGLQGNVDDYYNPANSYLPDVLRTRLGIPISLVLIYRRVAAPLGLKVHGVNSPGHFLAEVENPDGNGGSVYVDPFYGGSLLTVPEVCQRIAQATGCSVDPAAVDLRRATSRQWLERMLTNLQAAFAAVGHDRDVCAMQELQALV